MLLFEGQKLVMTQSHWLIGREWVQGEVLYNPLHHWLVDFLLKDLLVQILDLNLEDQALHSVVELHPIQVDILDSKGG